MDFFSSLFNIIIAILIVSAVIWSFISGRVPKEGTPARKKYDEKMAKEEWERLNPPTYKTIEEISKPKPKAKKQQDYVEPVITEKMIDDFVLFLNKFQSKDEKKAFYTKIDFSEIDFRDLSIDFYVEIYTDLIEREYGGIECEELEHYEKGYDESVYHDISKLIQRHEIDEQEAEEFVRLIHQPSSFDPLRSPKNNVIFNKIDWDDFDAWNDSYIGTYFENGRELDFDKVATDMTISETQNYGPDTIREITSVKITKVDIPSIEMFIYDQEMNHPFNFKKSHQKYILIFLMCIYRKDLGEQINQALKAKIS